jgi:hypothetical protein
MSKASFAVELLNNAKADIINSRNRLNQGAKGLSAVRKQLLHIIKMVCPEPIGDRWDNTGYSIVAHVDATYCQPEVSFYMSNLDGFKDERLEAVLWYLSTLDGEREPRSSEYAQSLNRTYRFDFKGFCVRVDATVRSDSPTCRKVVVSSELVKQDKYVIQCD